MSLIYSDCYLLTDIEFNSQRIYHLLQRRFKSNSNETSFDFKSIRPEQPSNNAKVSRSLLRYQPKLQYFHDNNDDDTSSNSSSSASSDEDNNDNDTAASTNEEDEDDYLDKLAEWEPASLRSSAETDDDENEEENHNEETMQSINTDSNDHESTPMDICSDSETINNQSQAEDLLVTYVHRPPKSEPLPYESNIFDCLPQFDGQMDYLLSKSTNQSTENNNNQKRLDDVVAKLKAKKQQSSKVIQIHEIPSKTNKFRLTDNNKHKSVIPSPKKSSTKIDRPKEANFKISKSIKKTPSRLLSSLLKSNEDAIRPLSTRMPSTPPVLPKHSVKSMRLSSDCSLTPLARKFQDSKKPLSHKENLSEKLQQKRSVSLSLTNKPPSKEHSAKHYMSLAQKEYKHFQKHQQTKTQPISSFTKQKSKEPKKITTIDTLFRAAQSVSSSVINDVIQKKKKKIKRLDAPTKTISNSKEKTSKSISNQTSKEPEPNLQQSYLLIVPSSPTASKRPDNYFEGCIELDDDEPTPMNNTDDDIQEIEKLHYSIAHSIRSRERLLDNAVHLPSMHLQWLFNLEHVLLEHISICHENHLQSSASSSPQTYTIDPSVISKIIINFLKMFILRNNSFDQQEVIFLQFGLTSHLRYLLIELPTSNHTDEKDSQYNCDQCHQYSLIINILFDLLFDLIEYDLCENYKKVHYRSTLIENDYFTRFLQSKLTHRDPFYRIKFVIYLIELIALHMKKCSTRRQFQFNKDEDHLFDSMKDFIKKILAQTHENRNQRLSICFNVLELCLLFVNKIIKRVKQMSIFLVDLCANDSSYKKLFLFDKNLFVDIRLLFINELINETYSIKLSSLDHIREFFGRIQVKFNSTTNIDEDILVLLRSFFSTYADLFMELKSFDKYVSISQKELRIVLETELDLIFRKLLKLSDEDQQLFEQMKKSLFSFRLLKCKWNQL